MSGSGQGGFRFWVGDSGLKVQGLSDVEFGRTRSQRTWKINWV